MFSLEWQITLYFQLDTYAMKAKYLLSSKTQSQSAIPGAPKLLSGPQDVNTGLWCINLKQTNNHIPEPIANNVYE
jgi:hypothetical protein